MWVFIIFVMVVFTTLLIYGTWFPSEGKTKGIVTKVETEIRKPYRNPQRHMQMNADCRSYRIYVRYSWQGCEYEAKSFAAYSTTKYFPGDEINILVHRKDKNIVKIIE